MLCLLRCSKSNFTSDSGPYIIEKLLNEQRFIKPPNLDDLHRILCISQKFFGKIIAEKQFVIIFFVLLQGYYFQRDKNLIQLACEKEKISKYDTRTYLFC